jgi:hypothetical protein
MNAVHMMAALVVGAGSSVALGGLSCLISDDFADGTGAGIWTYSNNGGAVSASESGGHISFSSSGTSGFTEDGAFGWSTGWAMDMSQDWALSADWYFNPPSPSEDGDIGLSMAVMLAGDPETVYYGYGISTTIGVYNWGDGDLGPYEAFVLWEDNDWQVLDEDIPATNSGTLYVWYDAATDKLYMSDVLYGGDPWVRSLFLAGYPSATVATVGFAAHSAGPAPSFGSSAMYGDNWCVISGAVLGTSVGACCIDDSCVQTIEQSCDGEWQGAESDCDTCTASCYGDVSGDGTVNDTDVLDLIAQWGDTGGDCDIDGSGTVEVHDLLGLLQHWGAC